jgi:hypothetical protein
MAVAGLGLAATLVGLATGIADLGDRLFPDPKVKDPNVEIVLDRSAAMAQNWAAGTTRFAAAVRRVDEIVGGEERGHNVALRAFGGACDEESERLVGFGTDNADRIRDALAGEQVRGESNLVIAVADATGDFADLERFPNDVGKRIIVVTAGHTCGGDATSQIRERFRTIGRERRISLDFRFVGVGVPEEDRLELRDLARELRAPEPLFAETEDELDRALQQLAVTEPLLESISAVRELVDASVGQLNAFADSTFDHPDAGEARAQRRLAEATVQRTRVRFDRLAKRHGEGPLAELYRLAAANRALQSRFLELADEHIDLAERDKGSGEEEVAAAVDAWNTVVGDYNDNNAAMDEIVRKLTV